MSLMNHRNDSSDCENLPLGPGCPRSPFREKAKVSGKQIFFVIHLVDSLEKTGWGVHDKPLTALDWSSARISCWTVFWRAVMSFSRLMLFSEFVAGLTMLIPLEADRRLELADWSDTVSRASTRFLRFLTSSPGRRDQKMIYSECQSW